MNKSKLSLSSPITDLKGVTKYYKNKMKKVGIETINDALTYFPFRYNDFQAHNLSQVANKSKITVKGIIITKPQISVFGYKRTRLHFSLNCNGNKIYVNFFNQPWLMKKLNLDETVMIYGRINTFSRQLNASRLLTEKEANHMNAIYPSSQKVHQVSIRKVIHAAYSQCSDLIKDYVPKAIRDKYKLESNKQVIHDLHYPANREDEMRARRTAKFNEFFLFQMRIQAMKVKKSKAKGTQVNYDINKIKKFIKSLPFSLTDAQKKVVNEISADLLRPVEMNRLLQGDVGSGKTIVAAIAIYEAKTAGLQSAIMVPTSVLARQHAKNLSKTFKGFHVNIGLLTGDIKPRAKRELLAHLKNGDIDLIIGTDALIQKDVRYHNLGLAVIDEQHRFGVDQRQALREKGNRPNMLAMTATPIPRTLAITTYGDMDVSIINQLPNGRKPVITRWIRLKQMTKYLPFLERIMDKGQQIYAVAPLVKQTDKSDSSMLDAETIYKTFKYHFGNKYKIGLLHGQMDDEQKNKVMTDFKAGRYQMLVATTVIEVGVDVSNASMMLIFNADHFGLSQLHQLRGRVGRGSQQAYCILVSDPKSKNGVKRMKVMCHTDNGFIVSQKDLELRGAGDIFGQNQSGIPSFKVGDPIGDKIILEYAQMEAHHVVDEKNWSKLKKNQGLVQELKETGHANVLD